MSVPELIVNRDFKSLVGSGSDQPVKLVDFPIILRQYNYHFKTKLQKGLVIKIS